jgi:hypothetical protein
MQPAGTGKKKEKILPLFHHLRCRFPVINLVAKKVGAH